MWNPRLTCGKRGRIHAGSMGNDRGYSTRRRMRYRPQPPHRPRRLRQRRDAPGGTLSGTLTVASARGVATFSNLSVNNAGTGYTLTAAAPLLTSATSAAFNITP